MLVNVLSCYAFVDSGRVGVSPYFGDLSPRTKMGSLPPSHTLCAYFVSQKHRDVCKQMLPRLRLPPLCWVSTTACGLLPGEARPWVGSTPFRRSHVHVLRRDFSDLSCLSCSGCLRQRFSVNRFVRFFHEARSSVRLLLRVRRLLELSTPLFVLFCLLVRR